ncbi:hypothetical protein N9L06_04000 [Mariniblastus sp.]|nr:hypothetical protein [Mariniblastus sp.]
MLALCLLISLVGTPCSALAQQATSGTSSRAAKQRAIDSLPYQHLTERAKQNLNQVLKSPSFYRRLPATSIEADPEYLQFLIRHPEVIVNIWQLMGVTKMSCERTGPFSLKTNDGAGTISDLELMYGSQDLHIFYGRGTYEGAVIRRPISGNCVLIVRTSYQPGPSGTPIATNELDVFLKVDSATANLVAKTLQPLIGPTADHNFVESLKFVQRLNDTTERNGPGVQKMAERFQVTPKVRADFIRVAGNVYDRGSYGTRSRQPAIPAAAAAYQRPATAEAWQNREVRANEGAYLDRARSARQYGSQPPVYQLGDRSGRSGYINR